MDRIACLLLAVLFCTTSCATRGRTNDNLSTWQQSMKVLQLKAKAREYDYIIDNLLGRELVDLMIARHGKDNWRARLRESKLESLPFYFGWLKNCDVRNEGNKVILTGEAGCHATFINVEGRYLLLDVGQKITSM